MGLAIAIEIPPDDHTEEVLYAYCHRKRRRQQDLRPNEDWGAIEEMSSYLSYNISLNEHGSLPLTEQISRAIFGLIDTEQFYEIFSSDVYTNITLYRDDITELIKFFRTAELDSHEEPTLDVEWILETGPIHLCEFALEQGYGVSLAE